MTSDSSSLRFFTAQDADPHALDGERVAVLGYGYLGRTFALNLRDSGVAPLVIGNIDDEYAEEARAEALTVLPISKAVAASDIVLVLLPDEVIPEVFPADIVPNLAPGAAIVFASGYTLAYGLIEPPPGIDVLLLAPRMAGENARQRFLDRQGFFAYVSVEQEAGDSARLSSTMARTGATGSKAWARLLGLAHAVGILWAGALELDARREADLDLFVEQTVGAVVGVAIMSAFAIGVEADIPPEALVMEMYMSEEMEMVFRSFRRQGFFRASDSHGPTALYGGFVRTMQLMTSDIGAKFRETMDEIQRGQFAKQFQAEREAGYPMLSQAQSMTAEESPTTRPIVQAEARLRAVMSLER
jgi:ketol-acid reductoisomerase